MLVSSCIRCQYIIHVKTEAVYATTVAILSLVGYIIMGITGGNHGNSHRARVGPVRHLVDYSEDELHSEARYVVEEAGDGSAIVRVAAQHGCGGVVPHHASFLPL